MGSYHQLPPYPEVEAKAIALEVEVPLRAEPLFAGRGEMRNLRISLPIACDSDVVTARHKGRSLAAELGFSPSDSTFVATAISELARNIVWYATRGEILLETARNCTRVGIVMTARDDGPGIPSIDQALRDGYSSSGSLGLGLPGVRRLADEFEIVSEIGRGTTVTVRKWTALREAASRGEGSRSDIIADAADPPPRDYCNAA